MAECNFGTAFLDGDILKDPASKSRTNRTECLALRHKPLDDRVGVAFDDPEWDSKRGKVVRQDMSRETGLFLVKVDSDQLKLDRCLPLQRHQKVE
jgi:hypothetical protein